MSHFTSTSVLMNVPSCRNESAEAIQNRTNLLKKLDVDQVRCGAI
jgi:hypothetical protein